LTVRGSEHLGITVPKLDEAVNFFADVIGCEAFYKLGPFKGDNDWMQVHLNGNPRAEIPQIRAVRCGHGINLEMFEYTSPDELGFSFALRELLDAEGPHVLASFGAFNLGVEAGQAGFAALVFGLSALAAGWSWSAHAHTRGRAAVALGCAAIALVWTVERGRMLLA
jgi:catechol 2,3-dioxygenase-like lactoylglutathione lyase family enzyme